MGEMDRTSVRVNLGISPLRSGCGGEEPHYTAILPVGALRVSFGQRLEPGRLDDLARFVDGRPAETGDSELTAHAALYRWDATICERYATPSYFPASCGAFNRISRSCPSSLRSTRFWRDFTNSVNVL